MKIALRFILFAALVALGVWLWLILFPNPAKVIRQRLTELARTASSSANESDLMRLAAARNVAGFFSTNVELNVNLPQLGQRNSVDREEITQAALVARSREVQVKFPDINVTVAPDRQSAVADLTVEAKVPGEPDPMVQEMKFTLRQIDSQWLITRVETIRTLSWRRQIFPRHFELCTAADSFHS